MLGFFRKYQRYLFIFITIIIVISFTFFGTYSTLTFTPATEQTAFTAIDGERIEQWQLEQMVRFLSTDQTTQTMLQTVWGPNFLNDGVLVKDFLQTGLAQVLAEKYSQQIKPDLNERLKREQSISHYTHPSARFISADAVWSYFAREIKQGLQKLAQVEDPTDVQAMKARIDLFLAEQQFPPGALKQVLRMQEKQYNWLAPDPRLQGADLSLFGYHTIEDWFGPRFVRLAAMFILNSAKLAEQQGYRVSEEEALADLVHHAEVSYQKISAAANTGFSDPVSYMREELRRLRIEQSQAVAIWQNVLLFRRLFEAVGQAVFVDPLSFELFNEFALDTLVGDLYQIPKELELSSFQDLQLFETYLDAVAERKSRSHPLELPDSFYSAQKVKSSSPALVQKRYLVQIAKLPVHNLHARIRIKELWDWQTQDDHWQTLAKQFPELGIPGATTQQARFAVLEELDETTRMRLDSFSRKQIVQEHPEWIKEALANAPSEEQLIALQAEGGKAPFPGVEDQKELMALLDTAALQKETNSSQSAQEAAQQLALYTPDKHTYYRIELIERDPKWQVLTFGQAKKNGGLDALLKKKLRSVYETVRSADPEPYQQKDKSPKPLEEVQDLVAKEAFQKVIEAVEKEYVKSKADQSEPFDVQKAAAYRFYSPMQKALSALKENPDSFSAWIKEEKKEALLSSEDLQEQWKLEKSVQTLRRSDDGGAIADASVFALEEGAWTDVKRRPNGALWFFQVNTKKVSPASVMVAQQMAAAQSVLAAEAKRLLAARALQEFEEKKAMTLVERKEYEQEPDGEI